MSKFQKWKKVLISSLFILSQVGVSNEAFSQSDIVTANRNGSTCDTGHSSWDLVACSISFNSPVSGLSGVVWMKNTILSSTWRAMSASDGASYTLDSAGVVSSLNFLNTPTEIKVIPGEYDFPAGYYVVRNATGLYWAVYLAFRSDSNLTWSPPYSQYGWQICSPTDSFRRDIGCFSTNG